MLRVTPLCESIVPPYYVATFPNRTKGTDPFFLRCNVSDTRTFKSLHKIKMVWKSFSGYEAPAVSMSYAAGAT